MINLQEADMFMTNLRALRVAGNVDALLALFEDQAVFKIVGFGEPAIGKAAIKVALDRLVQEFEFLKYRPIKIFVNGNDMSVQHGVEVRHRPSGTIVDTETSDFLTMTDGKCASYTQYADTALIIALSKSSSGES